jgi:putative ABC transport system permease protein
MMAYQNPGLALLVILTAAIGIGSGVGVFTYMDALLFKPLPFRQHDQLLRLSGIEPQIVNIPFSGPDLEDIRTQAQSFDEIVAYDNYAAFDLTTRDESIHLAGASVSPDFFQFLGVTPLLGRTFLPAEGEGSGNPVLILSYKLWHTQFGGAPRVLGSAININGREFTVVGVLPRGFWFPGMQDAMLWVPLSQKPFELNAGDMTVRGNHWLKLIARLKAGVSITQAQSEMDRISTDLQHLYPESNRNLKWAVEPFRKWINEDTAAAAPGLVAVCLLIIGIASANIAVLVLLRITARRRETAIQLALGADKLRVYVEEAGNLFVLSLVGGMAGSVLSYLIIRATPIPAADATPLLQNLKIDHRILLVFALMIVGSSAVAGLAATGGILRRNWADALRSYGLGKTDVSTSRKLQRFLACQVALATILIVGAMTLYRDLARVATINPGFDTKHVLTMEVDLAPSRYRTDEDRARFAQVLLNRIRVIPGVEAAAVATFLPFGGLHGSGRFSVVGSSDDNTWSGPPAEHNSVSPGFFNTMQVPILAGRDFMDSDSTEQVIIISSSLADTYFKGKNPVGGFMKLEGGSGAFRIVGVAGNVKRVSLNEAPLLYIYFPYQEDAAATIFLAARTGGGSSLRLAGSIKTVIRDVDEMQAISNLASMEDRVAKSLSGTKFDAGLVGACASLALFLALITVYSTVGYAITTRTHEIGIHMAMGAQAKHLVSLLLKKVLAYIVAGEVIGIICVPFLRALLNKWTVIAVPIDPELLSLSCLAIGVVVMIAALLQAWKATNIHPAQALRNE